MKISQKELKQIILEELGNKEVVEEGRPDLTTAVSLAMEVLQEITRSGGKREFAYQKMISIFSFVGADAAGDALQEKIAELPPQFLSK